MSAVVAVDAPGRPRWRRFAPPLRSLLITAGIIGAVGAAKVALVALGDRHIYQFSTPAPVILLGAIIGMTYGLLGVGLVLIYRTNRIINFAHGQIGAFGAAVFGLVVVKYHVPYWICFPLALAVSGVIGAGAEATVVRRFRSYPRIVSIVASLGVGQFLVAFAAALNSKASAGALFPEPSWLPVFKVGALLVTPAYSGMLILTPLLVLATGAFLRYSRFGIALRGAAANPEAARMSGIFSGRMSSLAWAIAGAMSAFSAILTQPTQGFTSGQTFGPALLLRAMTCAVVARMTSMPKALAAGVGLGILEQLLLWNYPRAGLVEAALFVIILATLMFQKRQGGRDEEKGSWAAVQALRPLPDVVRQFWLVRNMSRVVAVAALALAISLPMVISNSLAVDFTGIFAFAIVGISVGLLTGLGGQLTLGQFAVAAVGATISFYISSHTHDFFLGFVYAGLGAGVVSVAIGLPSLRIRGLMLTVTTLSFALATPAWLLAQPWMLGSGQTPSPPSVMGRSLDTGHSYYYFALALLVVCAFLVRNIRQSGLGRLLRAVRDNEDNARAFTVSASSVKLQGYLLAGFVAGIGGAVYGHSLSSIGVSTFPAEASIDLVVMAVLGGISVLSGPIIGALWVIGIPLLPLDTAGIAATQLGSLLLILFFPSGIVGAVTPARDWIATRVAARHGIHVDLKRDDPIGATTRIAGADLPATAAAPLVATDGGRRTHHHRSAGTLLVADNLHKRFGGVVAVDGVSFTVKAGETLGLIGPNGAGKTTTFELLGGFTTPDSGRVVFDHQDVTGLAPEARAKLGLIRSFQDAALFPTMTVIETVKLGMERSRPTRLLESIAGLPFSEREKERRARHAISAMGLDSYRDKQIQQLSTGTRRITEIACLVALEPTLLLLDEPSSGIAQRETEALGALLQRLKEQLGLTLVVIEHDIPLIMGISDRIVAMADGRVLCVGPPAEVRNHPKVVDSYLGGSITAIERSGPAGPAAAEMAVGATR
jgi:ABC-type branched-subunit amino acid transport system ATPase component/ABC-type branched-subunit amino acid transport system permease subunit